jgi:hypothetical protein
VLDYKYNTHELDFMVLTWWDEGLKDWCQAFSLKVRIIEKSLAKGIVA